jgi:hypothetical protein
MSFVKKGLAGLFLLTLLLSSCSRVPSSLAYKEHYTHLKMPISKSERITYSDYFLVILVEARHLDYTTSRGFFKTLAKHQTDGSKNGDVGHSWVYLEGWFNQERICVEGGHSGEVDECQPKYFEGVANYLEFGYSTPHIQRRYEPNPIKYLWEERSDGYFQEGSGKHRPTFAVKVDLSEEQFHTILEYIKNYDYTRYAIQGPQCTSFVTQIASIADLKLESILTMKIDPTLNIGGETLRFWEDPQYASITFPTPDVLEFSLMQAVCENKAEYALDWYLNERWKPIPFKEVLQNVRKFPARSYRVLSLK